MKTSIISAFFAEIVPPILRKRQNMPDGFAIVISTLIVVAGTVAIFFILMSKKGMDRGGDIRVCHFGKKNGGA